MLEFTSEYGISEDLHPELPAPEERTVDFSEVFPTVVDWRTNAPKDEMPAANTYSRADMAVLKTRRTPIQKQPETLLCLVGLSRRYFLGDDAYPTFLHDDDRVKTGLRPRAAHEVPFFTATTSRVIDMEDPDVATESSGTPSAIEKSPLDFDNENPSPPMTEEVSLEEEVAAMGPTLSKNAVEGGKSLPTMGLAAGPTFVTPADMKGVSDPDPLSYTEPQPHPEQGMTQFREIDLLPIHSWVTRRYLSARMGRDQQLPPGQPRRMPRCCRSHSAAGVAMGSQLRLRFEQEVRLLEKARAQIARRDQRIQPRAKNVDLTKELESLRTQFLDLRVSNDQLTKVEKRCAEMDARLDVLSFDFDEELYPHMMTTIAGRRWVIGHGLRLAIMKCAESIELRQAFVNVVYAGIAKGMSEDLTHGIEHGKAGRGLEVVKAYDPKANNKYLQALQELKDLKYPIVRDPRDTWAVKEEILLEEAIAANLSRPEKIKSCRVVCRTHGVGSANHARSDGVLISVPTVALQGLAILLADAATQTYTSEDDASPRLLRSKSLPPMYNLD
uniref:Transposase (Putative), gypsy type n=1 Tax=Tanacetum cinerariifolium TaxID=118510 RepID=A0A6L2KV45_TANCI|nr:transposase (putative), gypsy type [Tanacetum cinerariifolium]